MWNVLEFYDPGWQGHTKMWILDELREERIF